MKLNQLIKELKSLEDKRQAQLLQRFFKTGPGQYGEGDIFLGIKVPIQRQIVAKYWENLTFDEIEKLLQSEIHEHRLVGVLSLIKHYEKFPEKRKQISDLYLKNLAKGRINNWDLIDLSAHKILGRELIETDRRILYKLSESNLLWERRATIIACFAFIKEGDFKDALKLSEILLKDSHDLMHKAVGWVLREIGKKDEKSLTDFLDKHYKQMPRTMLRYSIEKLNNEQRTHYMRR